MTGGRWALGGAVVLLGGVAAYLAWDNHQLRDELAAARAERPVVAAEVEAAAVPAPGAGAAPTEDRRRGVGGWLRRLGGGGDRPELPGEVKETRAERRLRRQDEIRAFLGRDAGETEDEYRARIVPLIQAGLTGPREQLDKLRRELEGKAGVTDEQRARLEAVVADVSAEALEVTNAAIQGGDLTPYERNWAGVLSFAGGMGAVLDSAQGQIGSILRPEQLEVFQSSGFEWGEYLGLQVPWEQLRPPPPAPGS